MTAQRFISHRGVHLGCTIAGENSLEAVELARRAGFACIETDVRLSADGELVVMHDATLERTAIRADGGEPDAPVRVADVSLARLRADYRLRASDPQNRSRIPSLEEYLGACAEAGLLPFIELKLDDQPPEFSLRVLELADSVLGRGNYVMTSNRSANRAIRSLGIRDVPLMDILYQAPSFADVAALGEVTVAISATRYTPEEHRAHVERARSAGLETEVHADDVTAFTLALEHGVDLISTDVLAPDPPLGARIVRQTQLGDGTLRHTGTELVLDAAPLITFGGMFLELAWEGACEVRLGPQRFPLASSRPRRIRHQLMVAEEPAELRIALEPGCRIRDLALTIVEY